MSKDEAIRLASRALALYLTVWALVDVSCLPEEVHSFLHYYTEVALSSGNQYLRHYYLIRLAFMVTRIIGLSLLARLLFKGGPEAEDLLLPERGQDFPQN